MNSRRLGDPAYSGKGYMHLTPIYSTLFTDIDGKALDSHSVDICEYHFVAQRCRINRVPLYMYVAL